MTTPFVDSTKSVGDANKAQVAQAIIVQSYCLSVQQQPPVDFRGSAALDDQQNSINTALSNAQTHARKFTNDILRKIITNITNIDDYFNLHQSILGALPEGSSNEEWLQVLNAVRDEAVRYRQAAADTETELTTFSENLNSDAAVFARLVQDLNTSVNGDNAILESNKATLDSIQTKIDGEIAGIVVSGLAIAGGVFIVAVGAVSEFVTAGTSTSVVAGGVVVVAVGIGGTVAAAKALESFNDQKNAILRSNANLTDEVKVAMAVSSAYKSLSANCVAAVTAAVAMKNAWSFLERDLTKVIENANRGAEHGGSLRNLFLANADKAVQTVLQDTAIIKGQLTGVQTILAPGDLTVANAVIAASGKIPSPTRAIYATRIASPAPRSFYVHAVKAVPRTTTSLSSMGDKASNMSTSNIENATSGVIMQAYAMSVLRQPSVDFDASVTPQMETIQTRINSGLETAKVHARRYVDNIMPLIISNVSNITDFFNLHHVVATTLPSGQSNEVWLTVLTALIAKTNKYRSEAWGTLNLIKDLQGHLSNDSAVFSSVVIEANRIVNGDQGILASTQQQINDINNQLDGEISGVVKSSLAVVGGGIMIGIGAVTDAERVTVGGIAVGTAGVSGITAVSSAMHTSLIKREALLSTRSKLENEVKVALALSSGYNSLNDQCQRAVTAATEVVQSWEGMTNDLADLEQSLRDGARTADSVQAQFLMTARNEIEDVLADAKVVKEQMVGIEIRTSTRSTVGNFVSIEPEGGHARQFVNSMPRGIAALRFMPLAAPRGDLRALPFLNDMPRGIAALGVVPRAAPRGNLSNALLNVTESADRVTSYGGLPDEAEEIRRRVPGLAHSVYSFIKEMQRDVAEFTKGGISKIAIVLSLLQNGSKPSDTLIAVLVGELRREAGMARVTVSEQVALLGKTLSQVIEMKKQLAPIHERLEDDMSHLQARIDTANDRRRAAEHKYYYLIALGPFGLVGLAAALGVFLTVKSEVDGYESEMEKVRRKKETLDAMARSTDEFGRSFPGLVSASASLKNGVEIVAADLEERDRDILSETAVVMKLIMLSAKHEMETLARDAM